jgi:hypothetical protein
MSDNGPKSAYELAMERLRRKDEERGIVAEPLTDGQKAEIAEVRNRAEARIAELRILHASKLAGLFEPEARELLEEEHRRELRRIEEDRESRITRIREGTR